jgi:hypothetical protein
MKEESSSTENLYREVDIISKIKAISLYNYLDMAF